ncbi:hypothetical protein AB835_03495 [Candidatus Endobugula sertula]|uniref:Uncharacterized protein n=1 Tax=Candidatus Endobugula sertula TaxID=62101 RepID=A0A1D2QSF1_9GAMM|nr:hypothetical protein AB835_03495 [Candidatus Endobugula sertula]
MPKLKQWHTAAIQLIMENIMSNKINKETGMTLAHEVRLKNVVPQISTLNNDLKKQLALLDEDEIEVLTCIKDKLNSGLTDELAQAADTVGGFVW